MNKLGTYLKRTAPAILTCIASVGVIATTVLSSKAAIKAMRLLNEKASQSEQTLAKIETAKIVVPVYIPTVIVGVSTLACIFGANILNRRQQIALAGAYALASDRFRRYKQKVKDIYGEQAHQKIMEELAVEKCKEVNIEAPGLMTSSNLDFRDDEELHIFYDAFTERTFETTFSRVLQAEYHLNRNFALGGNVSVNDFFDFLGIERTDAGDIFGWTMAEGYSWIDFNHRKTILKDGIPCYIIEVQFEPIERFADW